MRKKFILSCMISLVMAGLPLYSVTTDEILPAVPATSFTFLTYNVYGYQILHPSRVDALMDLIEKSGADIIALQEVNSWFMERLCEEEWTANYYLSHSGATAPRGKLLILSRFPLKEISYISLPGREKRTALFSLVNLAGVDVAMVNCHLESPLAADETRFQQLRIISEVLKGYPLSVMAGDFNYGDNGKKEERAVAHYFLDLWRALKPVADGFTWDMARNPLAKRNAYPQEGSRRLDRIYLRGKGWSPLDIELVGNRPVGVHRAIPYPSDHFGLLGRIALDAQ